jgi:hypothetical protein
MTSDPPDNDEAASDEERAAASALARALDGEQAGEAAREEREAAGLLRAAAGRERLGELQARAIARQAIAEASRRAPARRRSLWAAAGGLAALALALALVLQLVRRPPQLPTELRSRSAGLLVPGPFPEAQSAADRLDLVTADRMVAMRELAVRRAAGRAR